VKLLEIFKMFRHDFINGPAIKEFIEIFAKNPESFKFIYNTFLPYVVKSLITAEQGGNLTEIKKGKETEAEFLCVTKLF